MLRTNINMGVCCTQKWPTQDELHLGVDFHVDYDKVDRNEVIPDFYQNVLCYSRGVADHLVC